MTSWVMAVEVTPSELVAVDVDRADRAGSGSLTPRRVPWDGGDGGDGAAGQDPVDVLADAFARAVAGAAHPDAAARPARVVVATPPDTERRRFEEIAEATALVGLPAPSWLPGPVALVGDRIAAEVEVGGQSVVLDARGGGLTAWPVRRTGVGAEIGTRGPIATGTRLDQLLLGVVRAQLRSLDPDASAASGDEPRPGSRSPGAARDLRGEAARLRRSIRRARARLAAEAVDEAAVTAEGVEVVVDRGVFDQLVEHAVRESLAEVADGPEGPPDPVVHVLTDRPSPLALRLAELTADGERAENALVVPGDAQDGVLGLAALLMPARSRPARAASGAQAIRAARAVGSAPTPVGVGAGPGPSGPDLAPDVPRERDGGPGDGLTDRSDDRPDDHTPPTGLTRSDGDAEDVLVPEARLPSSPVQAQHRRTSAEPDDPEPADTPRGAVAAPPEAPEHDEGPDDGPDRLPEHAAAGRPDQGHLALAAAAPHEVRPASDAPPGGRSPESGPRPVGDLGDTAQGGPEEGRLPRATVRGRRGPDTAPQPVPEPDDRAGRAPRGVVPVLVVLVVLAVLAAVGVLLVGPDQVDAAFAGLGAGTVGLASLIR
ncbi:hypothetical protein [Actinomycetospora sp. TBRC 11914]|uniref:hypothetical protein n=1 Tax=Actinomycetospora sp. TBRC 11914 TaxID=2729387 RepID=UPI00145D97F1|nr:hypothetical protein [Actinomycetospora sp. TBRC 11914]NMO92002.1 hypothetical protein [Actinomycetospora sp. TBRC 11914]